MNTYRKFAPGNISGHLAHAGRHPREQRRELAEPLEQVREPHHQSVVAEGRRDKHLDYFTYFDNE